MVGEGCLARYGRLDPIRGLCGAGLLLSGRVLVQSGASDSHRQERVAALPLRVFRGAAPVLRGDAFRKNFPQVLVSCVCVCWSCCWQARGGGGGGRGPTAHHHWAAQHSPRRDSAV